MDSYGIIRILWSMVSLQNNDIKNLVVGFFRTRTIVRYVLVKQTQEMASGCSSICWDHCTQEDIDQALATCSIHLGRKQSDIANV